MDAVTSVIKHYQTDKKIRLLLQNSQPDNDSKRLINPNQTRWSSQYLACHRLLQLQQYVQRITPRVPSFWENVKHLCELLQPFQQATDIIQQDSAVLVDVQGQFAKLLQRYSSLRSLDHPFLSDAASMTTTFIHRSAIIPSIMLTARDRI